jgi:chromatin assembly factor 1 subunit A
MEAAVPIPAHVASQKRPFNEDAEPSTPNRAITSTNSTPLSILSVDTPSPLKKASLSAGLGSGNDALAPAQTTPASSNAQQPAKRRKLTAQEKEDQRLEKEAKAKALAEKKEQKEAEDNLKAQQKEDRKRAKELKAQQNEEEKRKKDDEKRKKEEEKLKKERVSCGLPIPGLKN